MICPTNTRKKQTEMRGFKRLWARLAPSSWAQFPENAGKMHWIAWPPLPTVNGARHSGGNSKACKDLSELCPQLCPPDEAGSIGSQRCPHPGPRTPGQWNEAQMLVQAFSPLCSALHRKEWIWSDSCILTTSSACLTPCARRNKGWQVQLS